MVHCLILFFKAELRCLRSFVSLNRPHLVLNNGNQLRQAPKQAERSVIKENDIIFNRENKETLLKEIKNVKTSFFENLFLKKAESIGS